MPRQEADASVGEQLDQGKRPLGDWLAALRSLTQADYRQSAVRVEELEKIVDNPGLAPKQRIAAAVALSHDDDGRQRARIAARASADSHLRAALEAAAEGEIDERATNKANKRYLRARKTKS